MARTILTFNTTHQLLAAEKQLKQLSADCPCVRPTPTPAHLSDSVCGMALEILIPDLKKRILDILAAEDLQPKAVHELDKT